MSEKPWNSKKVVHYLRERVEGDRLPFFLFLFLIIYLFTSDKRDWNLDPSCHTLIKLDVSYRFHYYNNEGSDPVFLPYVKEE